MFSTTVRPRTEESSIRGGAPRDHFAALLRGLLERSVLLRDLYSQVHWHTSDIRWRPLHQLCEGHLHDQRQLIEILFERLKTLSGADEGLCISIAHPQSHFSCTHRGRNVRHRLLDRILEMHDEVLAQARPARRLATVEEEQWSREFAVGRVVLSNQLQRWSVEEHWPTDAGPCNYFSRSFGEFAHE